MSILDGVACCCAGMPTRDRDRDRAGRVGVCGVRASTVSAAGSGVASACICGASVSGCAVGVDGAMTGSLLGAALFPSPVPLVGTEAGVGGRCGPRGALLTNFGVCCAAGGAGVCARAGGVATLPRIGAAAGNSCVGGVGASMRMALAGAGGGVLAVAWLVGADAGPWATLAVLTMGAALRLVSSDAASVGGGLVVAMPALNGWVGGRSAAGGRAVRGNGRVGDSWVGASVGRGAALDGREWSPLRRAMGAVVLLGRSVRGAVDRVLVGAGGGANSHSGVTSFSWT